MTVIVDSIIQKNIPVAKVNQPVKINFDFNTNGLPETKNARIEVRVISDGIITDMSHAIPGGSVFEQSADKKTASVISISDNSAGWGKRRHVTLLFDALPEGRENYIVGTIYYFDANNIIGLGIPLVVGIDNEQTDMVGKITEMM
ncbi:hypothetical protein [uncultured Cedecea sp.]|uniref:hypothetical protein n=1 Tax=uncultured Cedecea sp. TaxID=988762 RepID=UPI00261A6B70|nr:hypothetical protein [uncultured Cedecea sp.]